MEGYCSYAAIPRQMAAGSQHVGPALSVPGSAVSCLFGQLLSACLACAATKRSWCLCVVQSWLVKARQRDRPVRQREEGLSCG